MGYLKKSIVGVGAIAAAGIIGAASQSYSRYKESSDSFERAVAEVLRRNPSLAVGDNLHLSIDNRSSGFFNDDERVSIPIAAKIISRTENQSDGEKIICVWTDRRLLKICTAIPHGPTG